MQKLTYQNILGETAEFLHEPYVLCEVRGVGMSGVRASASEGAYQEGERVTALRREGRRVKLTLHLVAKDRDELYRLRGGLLGILSPDRALDGERRARLIYENDACRRWTWAVPESGLDWGKRVGNTQPSATLSFRCESPFWYGLNKNETEFRARREGLTLPARLPFRLGSKVIRQTARNLGQADAPVAVSIQGKGERPELVNDSTGARIKLAAPLPDGELLIVNTDPAELSVRVRHADGREESGFGLLDPECSVAGFTLRPGDNELRYVPDGDASGSVIRVSWYDRYEGV